MGVRTTNDNNLYIGLDWVWIVGHWNGGGKTARAAVERGNVVNVSKAGERGNGVKMSRSREG